MEVISIKSWIMGAELSTAFRDRRVLLTGDAAHRTTPDGGVGMNTGLHSAHNLAWKVGAVVSGWAGPDLVDTYETERRAVAETNVAYSAKRGGGMIKMIEAVRAGDLDTVRAGIAARPAGGRQGMDLGFRYEEGAVASDGTTPPPVENPMAEYAQNACRGGRAPHLWVQRDGERASTLDACGGGLVAHRADPAAAWTDGRGRFLPHGVEPAAALRHRVPKPLGALSSVRRLGPSWARPTSPRRSHV